MVAFFHKRGMIWVDYSIECVPYASTTDRKRQIMTQDEKYMKAAIREAKKAGVKVTHKKFGIGTIIAVKDGGAVIDVAFAGVGIKSLAVEYAPIEIVK